MIRYKVAIVAMLVGMILLTIFLPSGGTLLATGDGGHPQSSGVRTVVTTHQTNDATVVNDPWCAKSEDSCVINYRPSGQWAIKRVIP